MEKIKGRYKQEVGFVERQERESFDNFKNLVERLFPYKSLEFNCPLEFKHSKNGFPDLIISVTQENDFKYIVDYGFGLCGAKAGSFILDIKSKKVLHKSVEKNPQKLEKAVNKFFPNLVNYRSYIKFLEVLRKGGLRV